MSVLSFIVYKESVYIIVWLFHTFNVLYNQMSVIISKDRLALTPLMINNITIDSFVVTIAFLIWD